MQNLSSCEISSDEKLLCKTAAIESLSPLPIFTMPSLFNIYGKMETIEHVRVLIEEDPVMKQEDMIVWLPENANHTEIKFQVHIRVYVRTFHLISFLLCCHKPFQ